MTDSDPHHQRHGPKPTKVYMLPLNLPEKLSIQHRSAGSAASRVTLEAHRLALAPVDLVSLSPSHIKVPLGGLLLFAVYHLPLLLLCFCLE